MEELMDILRELHPDVDFEKEDRLIEKGILDSFDIIRIISMLDKEYDITVPPSQIVPENFNSAQAMWDLMQKLENE